MKNDKNNISNEHTKTVSFVTWVGTGINIILAAVKGIFGYMAGSKVLIADAIHSLSDLATDAAILIGVKYWSAPPDDEHPYGHGKIETLVTFAIGLLLAGVGVLMGYDAIKIMINIIIVEKKAPTSEMNIALWFALMAAISSIIAKEILYRWTVKKGKEIASSAVIANAWHHRSDALSSIPPALAISGVIIGNLMGFNLWFLDPVGTIIVCYMLFMAAWDISVPSLSALIDTSANRKITASIFVATRAVDGVVTTHKIRTNHISLNTIKVDLHILVNRNFTVLKGHKISSDVKRALLKLKIENDNTQIIDVLVHLEPATHKEYESYINNKGK